MLLLAASDSTARAPMLHAMPTAEPVVDRWLAAARHDVRHEVGFYGALLAGKVYVMDCELVLGDRGPYVELRPRADGERRMLEAYTSRRQLPEGVDPLDVPAMPFVALLRALEAGVELELNPSTALARTMVAVELELLRRVITAG
jgi:hypothetical protein